MQKVWAKCGDYSDTYFFCYFQSDLQGKTHMHSHTHTVHIPAADVLLHAVTRLDHVLLGPGQELHEAAAPRLHGRGASHGVGGEQRRRQGPQVPRGVVVGQPTALHAHGHQVALLLRAGEAQADAHGVHGRPAAPARPVEGDPVVAVPLPLVQRHLGHAGDAWRGTTTGISSGIQLGCIVQCL